VSARTVVFVCAHGAARSRIAAAWFNAGPPPGWLAITAACQEPAASINPRVEPLLSGTPAHGRLDHGPPVELSTVDGADLVVAIDCAVRGAQSWNLAASEVDARMRDELRYRVAALVQALDRPDVRS